MVDTVACDADEAAGPNLLLRPIHPETWRIRSWYLPVKVYIDLGLTHHEFMNVDHGPKRCGVHIYVGLLCLFQDKSA
jgi:hypothetical protein